MTVDEVAGGNLGAAADERLAASQTYRGLVKVGGGGRVSVLVPRGGGGGDVRNGDGGRQKQW